METLENEPKHLIRHLIDLIFIALVLLGLFSGAAMVIYYVIHLLFNPCLFAMAPSSQCT